MTPIIETDVLIVGGGPVGLTLAMDLAQRGIEATVLELRRRGEPPSVKCNHVAARSMELFRRLGVARQLRDAGLPADYPNDVSYRTTMLGRELTRIPIPCRRDPKPVNSTRLRKATRLSDAACSKRMGSKKIWLILCGGSGCRPPSVGATFGRIATQDEASVTASARALDTGEALTFRARFLVGCDGGKSPTRRGIGAKLLGDPVVQRVQSTYIRAPNLLSLQKGPRAWVNFSLNPRRSGSVYAIDGRETFLIHKYLREEEADFESVDRDWAIRAILGVGADFDYEIISKEDWFGRRLVADKFRDRRVFLCGDSAHLWVPYAGYGMNAGLADAANLAWLLAAALNGWGTPGILDAYVRERQPITEQVSHFAMNHAHAMAKQRGAVPQEIEADTPEGEAARLRLGRLAYDLNVQQYCCGGLNFGYYYDNSPIIAYDGEKQPEYSMADFTPSTVPGCRTPHVRLADSTSLYDAMGPEYTLLRRDRKVAVEPLLEAADARLVPLKLVELVSDEAAPIYKQALVLSRPDQHVAWRGEKVPADPLALIDLVRGASPR